jgi:transposase-like protein
MNSLKNALLAPKGRETLVCGLERSGHTADVARAMGICLKTVYKWRERYSDYGLAGLQDCSSRPASSPDQTPADIEERVVALRRERRVMDRVAEQTGVSRATTGRILVHLDLNGWRDLETSVPVVRYERDHPGDLIPIDKKCWGSTPTTTGRFASPVLNTNLLSTMLAVPPM